MKKILIVLLMMLVMTGCSDTKRNQTLFVKDGDQYALCVDGTRKTAYIYDQYTPVGDNGFLVYIGEKASYISDTGKTLIEYKEDSTLQNIGEMLILQDKDKTEVYDSEGKELYKSSKKVNINVYGLPVIYKNKKYSVLDPQGNVFYESKEEVYYASYYNSFIVICQDEQTTIYDTSSSDEGLNVELIGQFDMLCQDYDKGYLLQDSEAKRLVFVSKKGKIKFDMENLIDSATISKNTIYAKKGKDTYLISLNGKTNVKATSYYYDSDQYLVKNDQYVYGPHQFVKDGKEKDVTGIQLNPEVNKVNGEIFPVYVQSKGYQYYTFAGKEKIKTYYKYAGDFTKDGVAIVSKDGEKYYLIDKTGKKLSKNYQMIKYVGKGYYAGYQTTTKYVVLDKEGNKVINDYFMGESEIYVYDNETYGLFNKSGTTHIYSMSDYEEEFTLNGDYHVYQDGYLVSSSEKTYYSMSGEKFYKR